MITALAVIGIILVCLGLWAFFYAAYYVLKIMYILFFASENTVEKMLKKSIERSEEFKCFEKELEEILND